MLHNDDDFEKIEKNILLYSSKPKKKKKKNEKERL